MGRVSQTEQPSCRLTLYCFSGAGFPWVPGYRVSWGTTQFRQTWGALPDIWGCGPGTGVALRGYGAGSVQVLGLSGRGRDGARAALMHVRRTDERSRRVAGVPRPRARFCMARSFPEQCGLRPHGAVERFRRARL